MMGGTAMPTPSEFWQDTIITDYIDPATGQNYTPVLVPTPESAASTSIPVGLANLQAIMDQQPAGQPYLIEGYSQSAQIAIDEKLELIASGNPPPDVTFLLLGSGNRPDGGFLERFAGLVIPGATGFDFNGAEPTDAGITTIDIANQYDGNADFPQYPVNVVADLNAVLGFVYQHAGYGDGPLPYPVPAIWPPSDSAVRTLCRRIRAWLNGCRQAGRRRHHVLFHPDHRHAAARPAAQPGRAGAGAQHLPAGAAGRSSRPATTDPSRSATRHRPS